MLLRDDILSRPRPSAAVAAMTIRLGDRLLSLHGDELADRTDHSLPKLYASQTRQRLEAEKWRSHVPASSLRNAVNL